MKTLSYHGTLDDTHLKRLNVTLHGIAQNEWNIVKNYSRQYNIAWNSYMKGASEYLESASDASSNYNAKTAEIQALVQEMINRDSSTISIVQEAQQEGADARTEVQQEAQEQTEELTKSAEELQEIVDAAQAATDAYIQASDKQMTALENEQVAQENRNNYDNTMELIASGNAGTSTYVNPDTGLPTTFTREEDGTVTLTGVQASDGTIGTVTYNPDGTMTFTTEDGQTMPWTGEDPAVIVDNDLATIVETAVNAEEAAKEAMAAADQAAKEMNEAQENATSAAIDLEDQNRENAAKDDPDTTNGNDDWGEWGDFVNGS